MEFFKKHINTLTQSLEKSMNEWKQGITNRNNKNADKGTQNVKQRLTTLSNFISQHYILLDFVTKHFLQLKDNKLALQQLGISNIEEMFTALRSIEIELRNVRSLVQNTLRDVNGMQKGANYLVEYYESTEEKLKEIQDAIKQMDSLITAEITALYKDARSIASKKGASKEMADAVKLIIAAEKEIANIK